MEISVVAFVGFLMAAMAIGIVIGCRLAGHVFRKHFGIGRDYDKKFEIIDRC